MPPAACASSSRPRRTSASPPESVRVWETFPERFGRDIGLRQQGYLFLLTDPAEEPVFRANLALAAEPGRSLALGDAGGDRRHQSLRRAGRCHRRHLLPGGRLVRYLRRHDRASPRPRARSASRSRRRRRSPASCVEGDRVRGVQTQRGDGQRAAGHHHAPGRRRAGWATWPASICRSIPTAA